MYLLYFTWRDFGLISHGGIFDSFHTGVGSYFRLISHGGVFYLIHTEGFCTHFTQRDFVLISHGGIWNQFTRGLDHILASFHTEGFWTHFTRGVGSYFSLISHGRILDSFHTAYIIIFQPHSHGGYDYILTYVHCCVGSSGP